jgi:RNA recognition motif-containing protein
LAADLHAKSALVLTIRSPQFSNKFHPERTSGSHARIATMRLDSLKGLSMSTKIYVGNLPYSVTDAHLKSNFGEYGTVSSAKVMMDRDTGKSKGFAFVEMASAELAQAAINGLNGMSVDGRAIVVNLARPREDRAPSGGYSPAAYRASNRSGVGYGTDGFGGGTY